MEHVQLEPTPGLEPGTARLQGWQKAHFDVR